MHFIKRILKYVKCISNFAGNKSYCSILNFVHFFSILSYSNFTQKALTFNLVNTFVGPLNATILVDSQYGRSQAARSLYYVTPTEQIYNYEAYARKYLKFFLFLNLIFMFSLKNLIFLKRNFKFEHKY